MLTIIVVVGLQGPPLAPPPCERRGELHLDRNLWVGVGERGEMVVVAVLTIIVGSRV